MFDRFMVVGAAFSSVSKFLHLQMKGRGDEGDDENAEPVDDAPFIQQLGLAVFPVVQRTLRALGWRYGDEVWVLKLWDKKKPVTGMQSGETRIYSVGKLSVQIRLLEDGSIQIASDGGNVVLNGGSLNVARESDGVTASGAFLAWMSAVSSAVMVPPMSGTEVGTISGGNSTVKA